VEVAEKNAISLPGRQITHSRSTHRVFLFSFLFQ
jgi:hypothetical protein